MSNVAVRGSDSTLESTTTGNSNFDEVIRMGKIIEDRVVLDTSTLVAAHLKDPAQADAHRDLDKLVREKDDFVKWFGDLERDYQAATSDERSKLEKLFPGQLLTSMQEKIGHITKEDVKAFEDDKDLQGLKEFNVSACSLYLAAVCGLSALVKPIAQQVSEGLVALRNEKKPSGVPK
ncbi:hypothetical protein BJ508DRAFT_323503 [Ascobolus immersus RN42]|uniref:Uncharacterized protein n=1 Tax=Ascobolus immersus RN42 TaxID=1160509 RepID=A0A3N4IEQ3_ASCIM|nr:hypothetical protein BJ508DRAFT_323503 [Ascobolus immersus RN42]